MLQSIHRAHKAHYRNGCLTPIPLSVKPLMQDLIFSWLINSLVQSGQEEWFSICEDSERWKVVPVYPLCSFLLLQSRNLACLHISFQDIKLTCYIVSNTELGIENINVTVCSELFFVVLQRGKNKRNEDVHQVLGINLNLGPPEWQPNVLPNHYTQAHLHISYF